ncbi:Slp family lipoprotein [Thiohalorhabdus sp.]|uniref:Slp family lipoprotein n=1 Tax=Thiohalorhabdus sp. TaxID=3094134 RepID=UPI002FC36FE9
MAVIPLLLVAACASQPRFDTNDTMLSVTPEDAVADMDRLKGIRVLWGGVIVAAHNREKTTRLEILGYPLNGRQHPVTTESPQRRFLAVKEGYLETADYAQGRRVTVAGTLTGTQSGRVGEATYTYPVVRIEDSHLWPKAESRRQEPRFHFGIGVLFGN